MDYWAEGIADAFEEIGIVATQEQIEFVAKAVEGAHENYGLYTGQECIPNPMAEENEQLRRKLEKEREKVTCDVCEGKSGLITRGPMHPGYTSCWKCRDTGRI